MSTQSISVKSIDNYFKKADDELQSLNNAYFNHKNFLLGKTPDRDRIRHYMLFSKILCAKNCEVENYIITKLNNTCQENKQHKKYYFNDFFEKKELLEEFEW